MRSSPKTSTRKPKLRGDGGRWKQREAICSGCFWASTGVKDKAYDDTRYVVDLASADTVNTMPAATLAAVSDHGHPHGDAIAGTYESAREVFRDLGRIGIVSRML